jgi:hypothetical protein
MNPKLLALAAMLAFIVVKVCQAHVPVPVGPVTFSVPLLALIALAELLALAGVVWAIVRAAGNYRSHPRPRDLRSAA